MRPSARILYVDKDKDSCDLGGALLKYSDLHCTVISTESAREARLLIVKERFDLYIFDYCLPEISGIELCRCVRQFDSLTPVLFFSAAARPGDVADAIEAGANEYIIKPKDLEKLSITVRRLLNESSPAQGRQPVLKNIVVLLPEASSEQDLQSDKFQPLIWKNVSRRAMANSLKIQFKRFSGIGNKTGEKKFNQNRIQRDGFSKMRIRSLLTGAAIFAIIILHTVSQFVFFRGEKIASETDAVNNRIVEIKPENESGAEIKTEFEARSLDNGTLPDTVPTESKFVAPRRVIKKKEPRQSKAERLRNAERILTGV